MRLLLLLIPFALLSCKGEPEIIDKSEENVESTVASDIALDGNHTQVEYVDTNQTIPQPVESDYSVKVFEHENGWGYQIFQKNEMVINQKHIPSVPGVNGFSSKEKALITGEFVKNQIEKGIFPPTVSPKILDSLGVL